MKVTFKKIISTCLFMILAFSVSLIAHASKSDDGHLTINSNKDFDIIDEQLALVHTPTNSNNGRVVSRKISLGDYIPDILKALDEQLRVSYSKRIILTTDEALPRHLFLTKVTSNNKFIITNK